MMFEIDETFESCEEWLGWVSDHDQLFGSNKILDLAKDVHRSGFTEPLTARRVEHAQIVLAESNLREGLVANGLNCRMRASLKVLHEKAELHPWHLMTMYAAEALTSTALLLRSMYPRFIGSEYGSDPAEIEALYPIPHQDLTSLTMPSGRFDIVTTNEVLEHVPDIDAALRELARILKPGGWHVSTHPFALTRDVGVRRARLVGREVEHLMEPEYHGNPTRPESGSLVFEVPGWDILRRAKAAGFSQSSMRFIASTENAILSENLGVFVLLAQK